MHTAVNAAAALAATLLAACTTGADRAPPVAGTSTPLAPAEATAWVDRGARTVQPFRQRLMGALQAALPSGADRAIETCRVEAPALAAASGGPGVTVGRTSHRLRNPANAPRPWVVPLLGEFVANPGAAAPRAVALPTGGIGYVEPIVTQPLCLACHGEALAPAVRARLAAQYPADEATGFRTGDLRGLFWVEFAPEALAPP